MKYSENDVFGIFKKGVLENSCPKTISSESFDDLVSEDYLRYPFIQENYEEFRNYNTVPIISDKPIEAL